MCIRDSATAWLLVGSIPGVLLGSQVTVGLPDRYLRIALAMVLFLSGMKLLDLPNEAIVIPLVLAGMSIFVVCALLRGRVARGVVQPGVRQL